MEPPTWSSFEQQYSQLRGGSPHPPSSTPPEDSLNNFAASNSNPLLMSSCQGLSIPRTNADPVTAAGIPNSNYDNIIPQPIQSSKETEFYEDTLYNGVCKENQTGGHNFLQAQGSAPRTEAFQTSETPGFTGQVPSQPFHSPNVELPVSGSFGVLPHESVKNHPGRFERNNTDKFASKQPSVSFNNGPYTDRDVSSVYSSAPLSAQSAFSGDTASLSPVVNSVTSPSLSNFSSPSEYYSSPKTNFGAYNTLQSPVPLSPSVAQSYPSSPFTSVDPVSHISSGPPCSPMSGGTYINNINTVPQRNGQKTQHSPNNSAANMCYNTPQSQNMTFHGPQSVLQKSTDYHSEYAVYAHDHNSPTSYSSVYPSMHPGQIPGSSNSRISPRTHTPHTNSLSHDGRMPYGHSNTMTPPISSPTYLQNKVSHEASYGACSSNIPPGQSMHPPRYPSCNPSMNPLRNNAIHPNPSSMMPDHLGNDRQFNFSSDLVDNKNALDMFNSHVDSGIHNHDAVNSITPFLENDLHLMDGGDVLTAGRQLRSSESDESRQNCAVNMENPTRTMVSRPPVPKEPQKDVRSLGTLNYSYSSSHLDPVRPGNFSLNPTRRRGRRGRRRKIDMNSGNMTRFQSFKSDRNIYSNGYPLQPSTMLDYRNVDCYNNAFDKRLCDEKEFPPVNYPLSRYRSELKMTDNRNKHCSVVLSKPTRKYSNVSDELNFLDSLQFPEEGEKDSPTFMKTRNKDSEGFLQCYKKFLTSQKYIPNFNVESSSESIKSKHYVNVYKEHKSKNKQAVPIENPRIIIRMGRINNSLRKWRIKGSSPSPVVISDDESASKSSGDDMISSQIKIENDAEGKSKRLRHTGKLNKVSERFSKQGAPKRTKSCENTEPNSETLLVGEIKIKSEIESSPEESDVQQLHSPKKRGRKGKSPATKSDSKKKMRKSSKTTDEAASFVPIIIKQEIIEDEEIEGSRRTLRSRRSDTNSSQETGPGPSIKKETIDDPRDHIDISSDDDIDILDDSDSDPAWTPSVKTPKVVDHAKPHIQMTGPKKRGPKARRSSAGAGSRAKKEKAGHPHPRRKSTSHTNKKEQPALDPNVKVKKEKIPTSPEIPEVLQISETECRSTKRPKKPQKIQKGAKKGISYPNLPLPSRSTKIEKEIRERFLVAKADVDKKTPFIWRVDKETNMLQRFEWYEQQGIILYRSTYTYAAWNEISFSNYVTANVRIVSHSRILYVVEYLGPESSELTESPSVPAPVPEVEAPSSTNPLRENFEVFLQTLISQALDPNFLTEITNENDEYFLNNIKEIENISEQKKKLTIKECWDDTLVKSINTYPSIKVLDCADSTSDAGECEVCKRGSKTKLLQLSGDAYNFTTLATTELPSFLKNQYDVCEACSVTLALYSHLHHQKYNFFIKCRAKMNTVRGTSDKMESHVLLEECLQDHTWVNTLYDELELMWKQCEEKS